MSVPNIELLEDEDGVEIISWPTPKYQRVCAQGHLVTDLYNSYEVSRGKDGTSYACKRCQLEANARQKEKKQGTVAGEPFEEIPDTPEHRDEIETEHAPAPGEKPGELVRGGVKVPLDSEVLTVLSRIESKMDAFIADRHPHIATRILTDQIAQLEAQIAELKKGPALEDMTFDQLKAKAAELGVEIPKGLRSAGARKLIEEHLAGQALDTTPEAEVADPVQDEIPFKEHEQDDTVNAPDDEPELDAATVEPAPEDEEPEVELQHEGIVEAESGEEVAEAPRRRRRRKTDEELEEEARAAEERARAKTAARKAAAEQEDEEPAPRRRRRRQRRDEDDDEG